MSSASYSIELLANIHIYLYRYIGIFLYVVGSIGNILTICVFIQKSWRKNVCVFYFLVCLISNTIFINCALLGGTLSVGFNISVQNSNIILCKLFIYVSYCFSSYFPIVLILASVDRLLISSQNVDTRLYSSKRLAYFSISISAFVWSLFSCHVLIKSFIQPIAPTIFICYFDLSKSYQDLYSYSTLVIEVLIFVLMITLSILAFKNVRRIRAIPRQQRKIRQMSKKDFQLLRCLYIHNINYIIFSTLLVVSVIYSSVIRYRTQTSLDQAMNTFLTNVGGFVYSISYCTSFFIFVSVSKAFRHELKRFAYKILGKDLRTIRDEENIQQHTAKNYIESNNIVVSTIVLSS